MGIGTQRARSAFVAILLLPALLHPALGEAPKPADEDADDAYAQMKLFTEAIQQVRMYYVDGSRVTYHDLIQSALRGMVENLDPYSQFMDEDSYASMKDDTAGQFGGLGLVVNMKDSALTVVTPIEDTPGFRAGILSGDRIIEIAGQNTERMNLADAVKLLRGAPGTRVSLKILRAKSDEVKFIEIERAEIQVASVKDGRYVSDGIGYVRITQFSEPTARLLDKELGKLDVDALKALVIDLRNNPGGLLDSAIQVSQRFLPARAEIVSTLGRAGETGETYRAGGRVHLTNFPIAILVNGGSASAAEIVAGALQDHHRAVLVGEKTYGKGSVQTIRPMPGDTALRLTTAKYYTPSHRVIHERGIEPDIVVPMEPGDWQKILERRAKQIPDDKENSVSDIQLERAKEVLLGVLAFQGRQAGPLTAQAPADSKD